MTAIYNPLLDAFTTEAPPVISRPWQVVCERIDGRIERAARKRDKPEAFKWLNVMDLLCVETSAYWRTTGWGLHNA